MDRRHRLSVLRGVAVGVLLLGASVGCSDGGAPSATSVEDSGPVTGPDTGPPSSESSAPAAREGRTADSAPVSFTPARVLLPGGDSARVRPARTVRGELVVPENVAHVGWWDGSAAAGDPFGTTVIAGHVDSATDGLGYFARLLEIEEGEEITLGSGADRLVYRVTSVRSVTKQTLDSSSAAFDQRGAHRLVLITCTGAYRPGEGYDSNLVVTAEPVASVS